MAEKTIAQKLQIKPGRIVLLVNAPPNYAALLEPLPEGVDIVAQPEQPVDLIQMFVASRAELEAQLAALKPLLKPSGILWVTYHKGTSRVKTDINRDTIAAYAETIGLQPVAMVAIDRDWAALRLKQI